MTTIGVVLVLAALLVWWSRSADPWGVQNRIDGLAHRAVRDTRRWVWIVPTAEGLATSDGPEEAVAAVRRAPLGVGFDLQWWPHGGRPLRAWRPTAGSTAALIGRVLREHEQVDHRAAAVDRERLRRLDRLPVAPPSTAERTGWAVAAGLLVLVLVLVLTSAPDIVCTFCCRGESQVDTTMLTMSRVNERAEIYDLRHHVRPAHLADLMGSGELEPIDAWGRPFVIVPATHTPWDLVSYGADGLPGGDGDDADLRWSDLSR